MRRAMRIFRAAGFTVLALCGIVPAQAETCEWDGERTICTPDASPTPTPRGSDDDYIDVPIYDPVAEKLKQDLEAYNSSVGAIFEVSNTLQPLMALPRPVNEAQLSGRIDQMLAAIWPEFSSGAVEAELLRRQSAFFDNRIAALNDTVAWHRNQLSAMDNDISYRQSQVAEAEYRFTATREFEGQLTALALAKLNDHSSERSAIATLLVFAPRPGLTRERLTPPPPVIELPGTRTAPLPPMPIAVPARPAVPSEPTNLARFALQLPASTAPIEEKLALLQRVGIELQQSDRDLRYLREAVPEKRVATRALQAEDHSLLTTLEPLLGQRGSLDLQVGQLNTAINTSVANLLNASTTTIVEVFADIALDISTDTLRELVDEIAGSAGLSARIPASRSQALFDLARRGGQVALPVSGYEKQWEAFVDAQEITLDVLDRATGFALEAAHVAASGSPEEMERTLERVFASVEWRAVDYVRLTGYSALPDGEDKSFIEDAFDRFVDKLRERQTGE